MPKYLSHEFQVPGLLQDGCSGIVAERVGTDLAWKPGALAEAMEEMAAVVA